MSPPMGTQILAGVALRAGHEARLFDSRLQAADDLIAAIDDFAPALIGLSFLSPSAPEAVELAGRMVRPDRTLVAGGVHASIHSGELLGTGAFDCVVLGEGENAFA